ncbi:MAG: Serine/threonine-protein kinase PknA, partial [Labilithrix sp.]|nr:Serine/threonine-protein kinase PknA [Labilithrix sp.]
ALAPALAPARALAPRTLLTLAPILAGLAVAAIGLYSSHATEPAPAPTKAITISAQKPLERTTADACSSCHARQVTEWQRSVMAHAVKSPLFGALESVVEEQVGRDTRCPNGAGVLRKASGDVCRDEKTGLTLTGAGGEHWCVNCHAAGDNLATTVPAWSAQSFSGGGNARKPLKDVLTSAAMEGISCAVCHQTIGPVHAPFAARANEYQGNATWTSFATGAVFRMRPEDGAGVSGIGNSGYLLDPSSFVTRTLGPGGPGDPIVHRPAPSDAKAYLGSSEFCGACHDVRLFGTDSLGVREKGEHFKRLRNAYSEWRTWSDTEKAAGRRAATCQDCHMSLYPGVCVAGSSSTSTSTSGGDGCPTGFHFEARAPGEKARGMIASSSSEPRPITSHYFTSVDLPLSTEFDDKWASDTSLDASGTPIGLELRRRQLLTHTFAFALGRTTRIGGQLEIPVEVRNTGAGHRVPAGFSQEREIWVELTVKDARGAVVYEVGRIADDDADLRDKAFVRVTTRDDNFDFKGKPQGVFGADVVDGPDVQRWTPNPNLGGTTFRGKGLINFQNGFLRCVKCIGIIDRDGKCQPGAGQGRTRADRFDDGVYDIDTGDCRSNLTGSNAFFETYFPVGALDADRGIAKAPDAILDTRSVPPGAQLRYTYEIETAGHPGPYVVQARLRFRPFPPFLLRAFADYEARKASAGLRPSGAQLTASMLRRNHPIDLAEASATID